MKPPKNMIEEELPENDTLEDADINKDIYLPTPVEEYDVFDPPEGYKGYIPKNVISLYGCVNCTWRGTYQCPYRFQKGEVKRRKHPIWTGLDFPENVKVEGICKYKKNYLLLMTGEWDKRPSYDIWQSRYMKNKGVIQNSKDELRYLKISKELELMEYDLTKFRMDRPQRSEWSDKDKEEYNLLKKEFIEKKKDYNDSRADFVQTWSMLEGFFEKGVDRETAKKIDVSIKKIPTMQEIQSAIKRFDDGNVEDAEYEVIEDKD